MLDGELIRVGGWHLLPSEILGSPALSLWRKPDATALRCPRVVQDLRKRSPGKDSKVSLSFLPEDAGIDLVKSSFCLFKMCSLHLGLESPPGGQWVRMGVGEPLFLSLLHSDSWMVNERAMELWNLGVPLLKG